MKWPASAELAPGQDQKTAEEKNKLHPLLWRQILAANWYSRGAGWVQYDGGAGEGTAEEDISILSDCGLLRFIMLGLCNASWDTCSVPGQDKHPLPRDRSQ